MGRYKAPLRDPKSPLRGPIRGSKGSYLEVDG